MQFIRNQHYLSKYKSIENGEPVKVVVYVIFCGHYRFMESKHPKDDEQVEGVKPEPYDRMQNLPCDAAHVVPPPPIYEGCG
jgi:hypothetical protein